MAVALAAGAFATAGQAQLGDVGEQAVDSDYTPVAKASERWQWFAGARFSASVGPRPEDVPEFSQTPFEVDFFDVSFRAKAAFDETDVGLAGGALCEQEVPAGASAEEARVALAGCERVPVVYRYAVNDVGEGAWEEVFRGDGRGFVGAVVWIDRERALAVGGTGRYPRRELRRAEGESDASYLARNDAGDEENAAGMARAWLYEGGAWRELEGEEVPAGMRGMTALAVEPKAFCREGSGPEAVEAEWGCAAAGGLRQIWHFRDGAFVKGWSSDGSAPLEVVRPELFRFRVRDIAGTTAVTAGCCAQDPLRANGPRTLSYNGTTWVVPAGQGDAGSQANDPLYAESQKHQRPGDAAWYLLFEQPLPSNSIVPYEAARDGIASGGSIYEDGYTTPSGAQLVPPLERLTGVPWPLHGVLPDPPPNPAEEQDDLFDEAYRGGFGRLSDATEPYRPIGVNASQAADTHSQAQTPDSFYAIGLLSAGGPEPGPGEDEPASQLAGGPAGGACCPALSSARLVARDATPAAGGVEAVGELRATGQGLAFGPAEEAPDRSHQALHGCNVAVDDARCDPSADRFVGNQRSLRLFKLPSYALNSVDVVTVSGGWAVGDYGAILSVAGETAAALQAQEPQPPELGSRDEGALPNSSAYDAFRPLGAGEPGLVPPLAGRPREQLDEPRFVPGGAPGTGDVGQIVMSRDGSEGWAFSSGDASYYDGTRWRRCDTKGIEGLVAPDPVCDGLVGRVRAVARVPLEDDPYPENDDEFELVAVGDKTPAGVEAPLVLRYRNGQWALDEGAMSEVKAQAGFDDDGFSDVAFTAPDDGWAVTVSSFGSFGVFHFDGERWTKCGLPATKAGCDDLGGRLLGFSNTNVESPGLRLATAGDRTYVYATRMVSESLGLAERSSYPMIVYHDAGEPCDSPGDGGCWRGSADGSDGGYDPAFGGDAAPEAQGRLASLAVGEGAGGAAEGWAVGQFGGNTAKTSTGGVGVGGEATAEAVLMRLDGGAWGRWSTDDASEDYLRAGAAPGQRQLLTSPAGAGRWSAFLFPDRRPSLGFNRERERWEALPAPFWTNMWAVFPIRPRGQGAVRAVAPNGRGGFWAAVRQQSAIGPLGLYFFDYTDRPPKPVFTDVAHPVTDRPITAIAGGGDGSLWVATPSSTLYRYDRLVGWDRVVVPGWDPPRSTVSSPVTAVAVGPDGRGIAVGPGGRIARIGPEGARLDPAAGTVCDLGAPVAPCGTGHPLGTAAVAPDGAALAVAGVATLLWRPGGGEFRRIEGPRIPPRTGVTGVSLPAADRAYLATADGEVVAGQRGGDGGWSWWREGLSESGASLALDAQGRPIRINALAVDASGHGYAVGDGGLVLERLGDCSWRRVATGFLDDFGSLALPPDGGEGALVGGTNGLILTLAGGRFEVAHHADPFDPVNGTTGDVARVPGVALVPGPEAGQLEAWAVLQNGDGFRPGLPPQALLHYSSDLGEPLLDPGSRAAALPDAPPARPGEIVFSAFGKQECRLIAEAQVCPETTGANLAHDVIARRVSEEILARSGRPGGPAFALFTGDANDAAGGTPTQTGFHDTHSPADRSLKHRRWLELLADPFAERLPLFGAIGGQDLSQVAVCDVSGCSGTRGASERSLPSEVTQYTGAGGAGVNVQWRETMGRWPAPWEAAGGGRETERLRFERVGDTSLSARAPEVSSPEVSVEDLGGGELARVESQPIAGGASTHYAVDVSDSASGERVARLVFVDTSLGSLAAGDPVQQPMEPDGGQAAWLEKMLCFKGTASVTHECDREPGQQAIVVSNTPTYTYARIPATDTQTDASAFEAILLRNRANVVVSGRLGWNGRYWATAPGVHEPCPGDPYQADPPRPGARVCGRGTGEAGVETPAPEQAAADLARELGGLGVSVPPEVERATGVGGTGVLPFVVAGSAGGRFNRAATEPKAADGYWRGYSIVRLDASGDPSKTIVEQRPVLDWVAIRAQERTLRPGQKMTLRGFGREPLGVDQAIRYIEIDSPAITHRYDLLLADPEQPWLPLEDANGDYVPLPAQVATVDRQTGALKTGRGRGERTYAIAILSVGEEAATYPLVFEPRRSFAPQRAKVTLPALPRAARAPVAQQPLRLTDAAPPPPPAPPATPATPISSTSLQAPQPPEFPSLPTVNPAGPPPAPSLNAPPPPPPPPPAPGVPPQQQPQPLALGAKVQAVAIVPSVNPPAPPPVNPAPPGGAAARKEAKQRQAATAKSEEGSSDGAGEGAGIDLGQGGGDGSPNGVGNAMTRTENPFTRVEPQPQASAWARGALYGGGLGLAALTLAAGWLTLRPRPRRRQPDLPAPAYARIRDRRS